MSYKLIKNGDIWLCENCGCYVPIHTHMKVHKCGCCGGDIDIQPALHEYLSNYKKQLEEELEEINKELEKCQTENKSA